MVRNLIILFLLPIYGIEAPIVAINGKPPKWDKKMIHQAEKDPLDFFDCFVNRSCFFSPPWCDPMFYQCNMGFSFQKEHDIYHYISPDGLFKDNYNEYPVTFGLYSKVNWNWKNQYIAVGFSEDKKMGAEHVFQCVVKLDRTTMSLKVHQPFSQSYNSIYKKNQYHSVFDYPTSFMSVGIKNDTLYCMIRFDSAYVQFLNKSFYLLLATGEAKDDLKTLKVHSLEKKSPFYPVISNDHYNIFNGAVDYILPHSETTSTSTTETVERTTNEVRGNQECANKGANRRSFDFLVLSVLFTVCFLLI